MGNPKRLEKSLLKGEIAVAEKAKRLLTTLAETMELFADVTEEFSDLVDEAARATYSTLGRNLRRNIDEVANFQDMMDVMLKKYESVN